MERYESTCSKCQHRWHWVGYKTGIGKTPAQLEEMDKAGKTCPQCGGPATVGLDHTSPGAHEQDRLLKGFAEALLGPLRASAPAEAAPVPAPVASKGPAKPLTEVAEDPYLPEHIDEVRKMATDPRYDRHFWVIVVRRLIKTTDILFDELRKRPKSAS